MDDELMHYGIKGQKWGVRRYQNEDGTLTTAGRKKYKLEMKEENRKAFEYGREASISSHAAAYAKNKSINSQYKYKKALLKDPNMIKSSTQKKRRYAELEKIKYNYTIFYKIPKKLSDDMLKLMKCLANSWKLMLEAQKKKPKNTATALSKSTVPKMLRT